MSSRLRHIGDFVVATLALALVAAPSAGAALGSGYSADPAGGIAMPPTTTGNEHFGATMVNAGGLLLVGVPDANGGEGAVVFVNPGSGETRRINAPLEPSHVGNPTRFGAGVAVIPDIGKCQSPPSSPGGPCALSATPDGMPDYVVGAPGGDLNSDKGKDLGRVYVYDGSGNDGLMKRIQIGPKPDAGMPVEGAPLEGTPAFGAAVSSASGLPPCNGSGGVGPCPAVDARVAKGDVDGGTVPDIVIGAPLYRETSETSPVCEVDPPSTCEPRGRVYIVKGEDLAAGGEGPLAAAASHLVFGGPLTYPYFHSDTSASPSFGGSIAPLGDVGFCDISAGLNGSVCPADRARNTPDGVPDLLVSGTGIDAGAIADAGAAFVIDGASGTVLSRLDQAIPSSNARFGTFSSGESAFGDLVDTALPDVYVGAPGQGQSSVFTGDGTLPLGSRLWAVANDPTPATAGGFGVSAAPTGDIGSDAPGELLIGEAGGGANNVHVFSPCANGIVQTIAPPAGSDGFGSAVASAGDVNGDGYADFAVGAPSTGGDEGRVYVMKSNGAPAPAFTACHPGGGDDGGGGSGGGGGSTGGGSGGGGTTTTTTTTTQPSTSRKKTRALATRRLTLSTNKKSVKAGLPIKLRGTMRASKKKRSCQLKQKVAIQRLKVPDTFWVTIDVAVTKKDGKFATTTTPAPADSSFYYRARVHGTKRCAPATSRRVKVRATP